jgi:hypothetical protein
MAVALANFSKAKLINPLATTRRTANKNEPPTERKIKKTICADSRDDLAWAPKECLLRKI